MLRNKLSRRHIVIFKNYDLASITIQINNAGLSKRKNKEMILIGRFLFNFNWAFKLKLYKTQLWTTEIAKTNRQAKTDWKLMQILNLSSLRLDIGVQLTFCIRPRLY